MDSVFTKTGETTEMRMNINLCVQSLSLSKKIDFDPNY